MVKGISGDKISCTWTTSKEVHVVEGISGVGKGDGKGGCKGDKWRKRISGW